MSLKALASALTVAILALSSLALAPLGSPIASATTPITPFSWNPRVPCAPLVVRLADITANRTGLASFDASPFSPGTTPPVPGADSKRWLTPGPTPPGWIAPGPSCTVTNSKGTTSLFVEIDGLKRSSLTNEDWSSLYDPANGGTSHSIQTSDTTFNLFDPAVVPNYSNSCTTASDPTCYGRIHAEIDHDWKAADYCGTGTACDNATLATQTSSASTLIDVQGFVYWDAGSATADWHQFSGWEIHPLTAWKLDNSPPPVPFNISVTPSNPQVGEPVSFTATASNGIGPASFSWDFGDGVTAAGNSVSHIFLASQTWNVYVTMTSANGSFTTWIIVPVGSWNQNVACGPVLTTLEGIIGSVSIQRVSSNVNSIGADYSGGGFRLDGNLVYGSNPSTWPFYRRDLHPPCIVNGTYAFVEFHNVTVINVSRENCGTDYQNGTLYPNGWQSCDTTFSLVTPGWGDDDTCPACYMHRVYAGIDRDWNASGIAAAPPAQGQRTDVQGFVFWNDADINASWHSYTGWEIHPLSSWRVTHNPITSGISFSPDNPTSAQTVTFNGTGLGGTGSYTFNWDFGDGTIVTGNTTSHTYAAGTYTVHLSATDFLGAVGTASQNITVRIPPDFTLSVNPSSVAFPAGSSVSVDVNVSSLHAFNGNVSLTVTASTGITSSVNQTSVALASGDSVGSTLTLSSLTPGTYTVTITGSSDLLSHSANVTVTVVDVGPTVGFSESTNTAFRDETITMTISSSDIDGTVTSLSVSWGDGTTDSLPGNAVTDSHVYLTAGTFTVNVTATDNAGLSTSTTKTNTITDAPPTVGFTQSATTAPTGTAISFDGSASSDPDGTIVSYAWDFGDGTTSSGVNPSHSYSLAGSYTVTLIVTDNATLTTSVSSVVQILDRPPMVSFNSSTPTAPTGTSIALAINATDPDGSVASIIVSWGDGTVDTLPGSATSDGHSYALAGHYSVYVNATDNAGLVTASSDASLTVTDRPPMVSFTESTSNTPTGTPVTLTINATDPDGTISTIIVSWGDGTVDHLLGNATSDSHSYPISGSYSVCVNATDDTNLTTQSRMASLTIIDRPPIISLNESVSTAFRDQAITLTMSSSDPDGTVTSLRVDWGDETIDILPGTSTTDTHAYVLAGAFAINVTATDNSGLSISATTVSFIVDAPPTVNLTTSHGSANTGQSITLAISSQDSDGTITQTAVDWGDGTTDSFLGAATTHTHAYTGTGSAKSQTFTVSVTVTDNATLTATSYTIVTIYDVPPTASFTSSTASTLTGDNISFDAAATNDPDGSITSYSWDFGDGGTALGAVVSHSYANTAGLTVKNFTVTLTVRDNSGSTASAQSVETIEDRPPTASFTASTLSATTGSTITFSAVASMDPDGTISGYSWNFGDSNTDIGPSVSHSYTSTGTTPTASFTVTLTVTDDSGNLGTSIATVIIEDLPPTASFTIEPLTSLSLTSLNFNASSCTDFDGTVTTYSWNFGDGSLGSGAVTTHSYANTGGGITGTLTVTLTIVDSSGRAASATEFVTITDRSPNAVFNSSSSLAYTGSTIAFNATGSNDADGTIAFYSWNFGDGNNGTGMITSHAYSATGNYTVILTVTDDSGSQSSLALELTILDRPPVAIFATSQTTSQMLASLSFNATGSFDLDGTIVGFAWSFGDDSTATGLVVSHSYASAGSYRVVLGVTDNNGLASFNSVVVTILGLRPNASFTFTPINPIVGQAVTFDASSSSTPNGVIASYAWNFGDNNTANSGSLTSHLYRHNGPYNVTLTVVDSNGGSGTAVSTIPVGIDDVPPSWQPGSTLFVQNVASGSDGTELILIWAPNSTDNGGLASYEIYVNGTLRATVGGNVTFYILTGMNPGFYQFKVESTDYAGLSSINGPTTTFEIPQQGPSQGGASGRALDT